MGTAKKNVLGDTKLLDKLQNYDKDNIDPDIMKKVEPYINNPDLKYVYVFVECGVINNPINFGQITQIYEKYQEYLYLITVMEDKSS